jgi:hypothetical protein
MSTLISVDWDYFFPRLIEFDWGHSESSGLYYEIAWTTRISDISLVTKEDALDIMVPDPNLLKGFWERACPIFAKNTLKARNPNMEESIKLRKQFRESLTTLKKISFESEGSSTNV